MILPPNVQTLLDRLYAADRAQRDAGLPSSQRTRNVTPASGRFLNLLARAMGARSIVEVGSSNAVSTIWLALATRDVGGTVTGTELLPARAAEANANLEAAGLADVARVLPGDARETIASLPGPFDLVFIDAEKDDYSAHFLAVVAKVRPNGVILADNVTSHDVSAYQALIRGRDDVATVTLPIERGIEYTLKLPTDAAARDTA
jgi:caffeoyl-CoA O-methyltransferase